MKYLLQLGRLPELSVHESEQLFAGLGTLTQFDPTYLYLESNQDSKVLEVLHTSAGIIKALSVIREIDESELVSALVEDLTSVEKPTFSVFFHATKKNQNIFKEVKTALKEKGISGRYIEGSAEGASAAILSHQEVSEYGVFMLNEQLTLAKTIWVQQIDHWSMKDVEKPHRNPDKGMMPPKLARMMINFISPEIRALSEKKLLDPFCGTGTLLMEALELGWKVIGSDLSREAVTQSGENLRWFSQKLSLPEEYSLSHLDATQIDAQKLGGKVHAIVTEPFLGKQQPRPEQLTNMFKGLEKQYLGILKRWTSVLEKGGEVVIVTPLVEVGQKRYDLSKIIDKSREFGYSILSGPLMYSRGHTIVKRAIYHLKYSKN